MKSIAKLIKELQVCFNLFMKMIKITYICSAY